MGAKRLSMKKTLLSLALVCTLGFAELALARPLVIGHRGASGYLPEHTLEAYALAIEQGADYIEPDLVPTKDGHLIARHENDISDTTDVSSRPEFAARKTRKVIDGRTVEGWFSEDFTLAEIKTLKARGRNRASRAHDGKYGIATLADILQALPQWEARYGRRIGIYPETKHPSYFRKLGLGLEEPLVKALHDAGYKDADDPVFIQSFEVTNLKKLKTMTALPLAQLVDSEGAPQDWVEAGSSRSYKDMLTAEGIREVATYARVLAPYKGLIVARRSDGSWAPESDVLDLAHQAGLLVHSWTFRAENGMLPPALRKGNDPEADGDLTGEVRHFFEAGLDGVFSNHPDQAVRARDDF